ncbi:hypothetical protein THARTR1_09772 [Trichoderma harzianum]|uniref:Hydrophobin n=1 Tax=Trichoderma harzianum TaxID=5544 RepID=A0A2K0TV94_TRIHA|nr:hypothetical protein THARTR1_09772 [Trichoderma harzianum]
MKFFTITAALAAVAAARPGEDTLNGWVDHHNDHPSRVCPEGLYSNPQCCNSYLLGILGLDCHARK